MLSQVGESGFQVLLFEIGRQSFAFRLEAVQEVVPMAELVRPPELPDTLEGFLILRMAPVPVLRSDRLFGLQPKFGLYAPLVVLKGSPNPVALRVERAVAVREVRPEQVAALTPLQTWNGMAEATLLLDEGSAALLGAANLLSRQEKMALAAFERRTVERMAAWRSVHDAR